MVRVPQVAELVQHYEVLQMLREEEESDIQVNVLFCGATSPVRGVVFNGNPFI